MTVAFHSVKVQNGPVSDRQQPDTFNHLLGLDNGRHTILPHLHPGSMNDVHTFIELLVLLQDIDTGMNYDPPDPAFKSTPVLKCVDLQKYLYKSFLEHILGIFPVMSKTVTHSQHF